MIPGRHFFWRHGYRRIAPRIVRRIMVYSDEFKASAIKRFEVVGSYWRAAKDVGVSIATLHRWVKQVQPKSEEQA